jgi:hypothetical protein
MTNILTLLFLDIVNPDVLKWEVSKMTVIEDFINVQDLGIGTLKLLIEGTFPKGLSNNSWLIKKAVDDDIEAVCFFFQLIFSFININSLDLDEFNNAWAAY